MKAVVYLLAAVFAFGCTSQSTKTEKEIPKPAEIKDAFAGTRGCFLLYDLKNQKFEKIFGEANCKEQLPACSTFKVPLAVMAFDSGVLRNENQVLKWDGMKDSRPEVNQDHNAKTWMRDSVVWFSQRLTPKLGEKKFQNYLNEFEYGNKDLKGGITQAWLVLPSSADPALKISAYEQIDFMKKLWTNALPVSKRSMTLTQEITYLETSPKGFKLSGKTGSNYYDPERKYKLGWFIAHLESSDRSKEYVLVTNFSDLLPADPEKNGGPRARALTKQLLTDLGYW